jgi:hypothetical protein
MAKYVPKINDTVLLDEGKVRYAVISVDANKETASIQSVLGRATFQKYDVAWARLIKLDASQNALQIVREATEDK